MNFFNNIILFMVISCHFHGGKAESEGNEFIEVFSCVSTEDSYDSTIETLTVDSILECSVLCSKSDGCQAFQISRLAPFTCILHSRTLQSQSCLEYPDTDLRAFNNMNAQCLNGGIKDGSGCQCFYGYIGDRCERIQRDCSQGRESGHYEFVRGIFLIHPDEYPSPLLADCYFTSWVGGGGRTHLMDRKQGVVDFNRSWADYKNGFGDLNTEYWIGLELFHHLTRIGGMKMTVEIETRQPDGTFVHRACHYLNFRVGNETDGYAFDFDSYLCSSGGRPLDDCLTPMKGKRFTTLDVDNDGLPGDNCAQIHEGAWWFTDCGQCNPNGPMIKPSNGTRLGIPNEAFWLPAIPTYSLIEIMMFVIPA